MKRLAILLSAALLGGCMSNPEKECGLYDFDCEDIPTGDPLFVPAPAAAPTQTAAASRPAAASPDTRAPAQAPGRPDANADLKTRVQMLEEEVRRLRRRLETLEAAR